MGLFGRPGDTYPSMSALLADLPPAGNYSLHCESSRGSRVALFAPHGGCIEPGTDRVVVALAGAEFDHFLFRGTRRSECYRTLHVTSARYDEPSCVRLASVAKLAISVHGCDGGASFIEVGGGNGERARSLREHLIRAGYDAIMAPAGRRGEEPDNFVNRSPGGGVQLELSAGLRAELFPGYPKTDQMHPIAFRAFIDAVRGWILAAEDAFGAA